MINDDGRCWWPPSRLYATIVNYLVPQDQPAGLGPTHRAMLCRRWDRATTVAITAWAVLGPTALMVWIVGHDDRWAWTVAAAVAFVAAVATASWRRDRRPVELGACPHRPSRPRLWLHRFDAWAAQGTTTATGVWRVQYISRRDVGEPDRLEGRHDFDTEAEARAYYDSDEVQSRMGPYWRAQLRHLPAPRVVESRPFQAVTAP